MVAVVGVEADHWADVLGTYPNVRRIPTPGAGTSESLTGAGGEPNVDAPIAVWAEVLRSRHRYTVHTADPLASVAAAWVGYYDGAGVAGELEVARLTLLAQDARGQVELPDYYLVVDADRLAITERHWYLGVLARSRVTRVVPVKGDQRELRRAVGGLAPGPWWPDLAELLGGIERVVPDRVGTVADGDRVGTVAEIGHVGNDH